MLLPSGSHLEAVLGQDGAVLSYFGAILEPSCDHLGPAWGHLRAFLELYEAFSSQLELPSVLVRGTWTCLACPSASSAFRRASWSHSAAPEVSESLKNQWFLCVFSVGSKLSFEPCCCLLGAILRLSQANMGLS